MTKRPNAPVPALSLALPAFCPDAEAAKDGFIVFNESRVHEVHPLSDNLIRRVTHFPTGAKKESIWFAGLLELQGSGIVRTPRQDLSPLLNLSPGTTHVFSFSVTGPFPARVEHDQLRVEKKKRRKIGECKYDVLEIVQAGALDDGPMQYTGCLLVYSPLLKYVVEMRMPGGRTAESLLAPLSARDRLIEHIRQQHAQLP
jgi:hypothetical protein